MLLLNSFQACNTAANLGWERLNIARRSADQGSEPSLNHLDQLRVTGKYGGGSGAVEVVCFR